MLIGFGTGVEVGISVAVAAGLGGRSVAVGAEIVVLRTAGVDRTVVAVGTSGAGAAQAENRMAKARIGRVSFFKTVSFTGKNFRLLHNFMGLQDFPACPEGFTG
jgi:hypothetical protein